MLDDYTPDPLPEGRLGPPRKRPPTAIGVATPEPPKPPRQIARRTFPSLRQRIILGAWRIAVLGSVLTTITIVNPVLGYCAMGTVVVGLTNSAVNRRRYRRRVVRLHARLCESTSSIPPFA